MKSLSAPCDKTVFPIPLAGETTEGEQAAKTFSTAYWTRTATTYAGMSPLGHPEFFKDLSKRTFVARRNIKRR
jgi:hypothetical protein